jgi:hypothetical protein
VVNREAETAKQKFPVRIGKIIMNDTQIYRLSGTAALVSIGLFFIEFPFYLVRGAFPGVTHASQLAEFTLRNATNIMTCVFFDFLILTLLMVFCAGLRYLIRRADPQLEWIGSLFFGLSLVFVTLTLIADSLQAATVVDALTVPADGVIIRTMYESMFLMYGAVALFLLSMMMALAGHAAMASGTLPRWSGWVAYICALACLAFVPSMFVRHVDLLGFYNPAGWGATAIASGFPLAAWMIVFGILMVRMRQPVAPQVLLTA